jgi:beta-glucanase (GH16 family)
MRRSAWILTSLLSLAMWGCGEARREAPPRDTSGSAGPPVEGYRLVWADEFDGDTLDTTKWDHRYLGRRRGAMNVKETVTLDGDGHLVLTTRRNGDVCESAMIGTQGKFETTFGYFECRAKLQTQVGHWSAFWIQSPANGQVIDDPANSGVEIDVLEYLCRTPDVVHHNLHWNGYGEHRRSGGGKATVPGLSEGWHTFGVLWTQTEYVFYVDGVETWRTDKAISKRPQYIILSLEVGKWAGDIREAKLPDHFTIDYVRVYQKDTP